MTKATKKKEKKKCLFGQRRPSLMKRLLTSLHNGVLVGVSVVPVLLVHLVGTSTNNSIKHSAFMTLVLSVHHRRFLIDSDHHEHGPNCYTRKVNV